MTPNPSSSTPLLNTINKSGPAIPQQPPPFTPPNYTPFDSSVDVRPVSTPALSPTVTQQVIHHYVVVQTTNDVLTRQTPCSDCSKTAVYPIITFGFVILALVSVFLCYPRLISIHVQTIGLDPHVFPPISFSLLPPSVSLHLLSNVSIYNPLFMDLFNVSVHANVLYPHFDPPVNIGFTTLSHVINLPSNQVSYEDIPFHIKLPSAVSLQIQPEWLQSPISVPSSRWRHLNVTNEHSLNPPALLDMVLALVDDCKSRGYIQLDLEISTKASTNWWLFGGSLTAVRDLRVMCDKYT